ncbi:hypothetical protein H632_c3401p0 [Helicosporidium sp. ATCC 50920]|nr:hypothetical protein H632_c3401p0 [Helicosporidium sp. ATCC 50920]|eukprot:KDD72395.1 hypothetical protein H632_c3401p0 [Helicosporidium sp. ATCC 50920]
MNAAYFVSHNHAGVTIYHDLIAHRGFLCLSRLWAAEDAKLARRHVEERLAELEDQCRQGGEGASDGLSAVLDPPTPPALDLEFLVDEIMGSVLPLDWRAVADSPVPLKVVASSLDALRPVLLEGFTSWADLALCLKASATVPRLAGGPRRHRGHRLVDAAVFDAVPFTSAIQDGCTHVLALSSRPEPPPLGSWSHRAGAALETLVKKLLFSPPYMAGAWRAEAAALGRAGMSQDHVLAGAREPLEPELEDYLALMEGEVVPGSWERRVPLVSVEEGVATLQRASGEGGKRRRRQGKGKSALHEPAEAFVYPVYPGAAASFSPLCIDPEVLRRGVAEGRASLLKAMHQTLAGVLDLQPWAREIADPRVGEEAHS